MLEKDTRVITLDNYVTRKVMNIHHLLKHPKFEFIQEDIRNLIDCKKVVKGVHYVIYQAALGSVRRSIKDLISSNDVKNILESNS